MHAVAHQPQSPLAAWAEEQRITNAQFITEPPLEDLLDAADLFVNDSPTTTLLQMLTTDRPILVLSNGAMVIESEALPHLRNSVFYGESPDELEVELRRRLAALDFADRIDDGLFLRLYGSYQGDGRSAERASVAIRNAVAAGRPLKRVTESVGGSVTES
jgi:hypothetical protein